MREATTEITSPCCNIKSPEGVHAEQREIEAYIKHIHKKYPNREIEYLNITIDDKGYVDLEYKLVPVSFERIRRITGYLSEVRQFNDGKKGELRDRVKHT